MTVRDCELPLYIKSLLSSLLLSWYDMILTTFTLSGINTTITNTTIILTARVYDIRARVGPSLYGQPIEHSHYLDCVRTHAQTYSMNQGLGLARELDKPVHYDNINYARYGLRAIDTDITASRSRLTVIVFPRDTPASI